MWDENNYSEYINKLLSLKDQKYLDFSSKLTFNNKEMIGIRIPILRKIAKEIVKCDIESFITNYIGNYYEETMVLGFVIGYSNDLSIYDKYLSLFVDNITDWAICDCCSSSFKLIGNNLDYFYKYIINLLNNDNEFYNRFGIVLLMKYYLVDDYIDKVIKIVLNIDSDKYYVNMAIAWLWCEAYIKYPNLIDKYICSKYLKIFILNKTISKICDSYRVNNKNKLVLKKRRI